MAHFAQIDENNIVQQVIVVHNNELLDENGYEKESKGIQFCESLLGGFWVQTSYNWEAPTPMPDDGKMYSWDEETTSWIEIIMPQ